MTQPILEQYAILGVALLKENVSKVSASGKTAASISSYVTKDRLQLIGRGYFDALETGRGPRESSQDSGFKSGLEEWLQIKGFETKTSKSGTKYYKLGDQWFSAKSLAWKINKEGDSLWKKGHGEKVRDVYSIALDAFAEELSRKVIDDKTKEMTAAILAPLTGPNTTTTVI